MKLRKMIEQNYQLTEKRLLQIEEKYNISKIILGLDKSKDKGKLKKFNTLFFLIHKKKFIEAIFETYKGEST